MKWLTLALGFGCCWLGASCSESERDFSKSDTAGSGGSASQSDGGTESNAGAGDKPSTTGAGGGTSGSGGRNTGEAGAGGSSGSGGTGACDDGETRSCSDAGLKGSCAEGEQVCDDGVWSDCSIEPADTDTCDPGNDDDCDGIKNEGCPCEAGTQRSCADAGLVGPCAEGTQTCNSDGTWGDCSIQPPGEDTCVEGNNDDCSGSPNEGCLCIEGVTTRECGACNDGTQVCTNGKTNQYGACTGATAMKTFYQDLDGDGYGSNVTKTSCTLPAGFVEVSGDCCDDAGDLELAAKIHPNQTEFFSKQANICGITWDYNCSDGIETSPAMLNSGCTASSVYPDCVQATSPPSTSLCGMNAGWANCVKSTANGGMCTGQGQAVPIKCH